MDKGVFGFIWRFSKRQQIILLLMTVLSYPFYYYALDLPKQIINDAIGGEDFPRNLLGFSLSQVGYLMVLSFVFLGLVKINGWFKYVINVYRGIAGERMLRRLRYRLVNQILRFPLLQFRTLSEGEVVAMVTTETETLGGFFGDAYSLPAFQGGMLITALIFMFVQDPILGFFAIALYPVQGWLIPKLQKRVNMFGKDRVKAVRKLSERISETVAGVSEIHAHNTMHYELADFSNQLGTIFGIRVKIYRLKFLIKFINNFLALVTPFFFLSIGGYLVLAQDLSLGALVAILAAYKDLGPPWKELLNFYQRTEDAKIKFDQLVERFNPPNMTDERLLEPVGAAPAKITGPIVVNNVSLVNENGENIIEGANLRFESNAHVAFIGTPGGGKNEMAQLLARQLVPTSGSIQVNGKDFSGAHESMTGRRFGYVDQNAYIRSGSIWDNLLYGLKHYPRRDPTNPELIEQYRKGLGESEAAGNSPFDINANWLDVADDAVDDLLEQSTVALNAVDLERDILAIGLRMTIDPATYPVLVEGLLKARDAVSEHIRTPSFRGLVEVWNPESYNSNASLAENILFGTPTDDYFKIDNLGKNPVILEALDKAVLREVFMTMGCDVAQLMIELFKDLPPGHEFFERYSFIDADDLPEYQKIVSEITTGGLSLLSDEHRGMLLELPFRLIPSKHRLGLIHEENEKRLLRLRHIFADILPDAHAESISFFDVERYNPASSILDNMLFGKIDSSRSDAREKIMELTIQVLDELGLKLHVIDAGLSFQVGIAGRRLSNQQRQKLAIARNLIKRPDVLVVNQATSVLDAASQPKVFEAVRSAMQDRGLVWVGEEQVDESAFSQTFRIDGGRVRQSSETTASGTADESRDAQPSVGDVGADTELLGRLPFFAGLDRSRLKLLAFTSERQTLEKGDILFKQGEPGNIACVIVEGVCDIIAETTTHHIKVAEIGRGGLLGELALLCEAPRTATVIATQRTTVLKIQKNVFIRLIDENPAVGANLSRILASKLEQMMQGINTRPDHATDGDKVNDG